jgi:hypothetical protein
MMIVSILLTAWFMLAKDETARQNIAIIWLVNFIA